MLTHALRYLKLGLSVIPLKPNGKGPLIKWQEYQSRKATEDEIRKWWSAAPNANIGIVTGTISNLAVVDLDGPEGLASASELGLTSTVSYLTGRGKQLWYLNKEGLGNSVKKLPGLDVRAEGGYVVAPPSIHENGRRYRWVGALSGLDRLSSFPTALLSVIVASSTETKPGKREGWISEALKELKDGNIDNTFTSILGRLRADGYSAEDARAFLEPHAKRVGAEDGHLEAKIENVWGRYEADDRKRTSNDMAGYRQPNEGLIIHSPANDDSWKQFEQRTVERSVRGEVVETGYAKLDQMLIGGLKSSRLFTVAARTGSGKTNWLLATARQICASGKRVLLFSTEMPYEDIWQRYINALENSQEFRQHQFYVCDSFAPNIEKVEEAINAIKPDVFMFDHINHVSEEQRELGAFMQGLNYLRRKYDVAGIVTAQLNRSADWVDLKTGEKVTPRMSMIKGSGTIEQASSRVLLLSETRVLPEYTEIVGNLDKNDNGQKGLVHFGLYQNPWRMCEL